MNFDLTSPPLTPKSLSRLMSSVKNNVGRGLNIALVNGEAGGVVWSLEGALGELGRGGPVRVGHIAGHWGEGVGRSGRGLGFLDSILRSGGKESGVSWGCRDGSPYTWVLGMGVGVGSQDAWVLSPALGNGVSWSPGSSDTWAVWMGRGGWGGEEQRGLGDRMPGFSGRRVGAVGAGSLEVSGFSPGWELVWGSDAASFLSRCEWGAD